MAVITYRCSGGRWRGAARGTVRRRGRARPPFNPGQDGRGLQGSERRAVMGGELCGRVDPRDLGGGHQYSVLGENDLRRHLSKLGCRYHEEELRK